MSNVITTAQIIVSIRNLAAANPDFVYEKPEGDAVCRYIHRDAEGEPIEGEGCIVGRVVTGFNIPAIKIDPSEGSGASSLLRRLESDGLVSISGWVDLQWIARVQEAQDAGARWPRAVEYADAADAAPVDNPLWMHEFFGEDELRD